MSKTKKNVEELLKGLLVTEEENAKIQENWMWIRLGDVCNFKRGPFGSAIKKSMFVPKGKDTYKVYEQGNAIRKTINYGSYYISREDFENLKGFEVNAGDIIVSCAGTIGETYVIPSKYERGVINQALMRVSISRALDKKYFLYAFDFYIKQLVKNNAKGTAIKNLPPLKELKQYVIPLPPLSEQKRIVEKAERLLNKIEEAKQLIKEAKETFELRRATILDKAFRGDLTRKWRRENSKTDDVFDYLTSLESITNFKGDGDILEPYSLPCGWKWSRIGDLFHVQVGTTPSRKNGAYWEGQYAWLSSGEVQFNNINESRECVTDLAVKERKLKLAPKGSILFGMIGEGKTRGQVALLNIDAFHNQNIASIWVSKTKINSFYVYHWLMSQYMKNRQNSAGSNQPAYNKSRVQNLLIPIPPLDEVDVIVNELQKLLGLEKEINILLSLDGRISDIKQSILSKAFQGELGTNDPSEENAIELLKEILQEQVK
ncbi:TPA: restriction endonuclease subunit S [Bacillus paranthracis]|uniref:restriction endonuclease subunit S n=1 Tax=Bacillus cereus group sp. MYBK111-1 TaxID=3450692 RepID=UPI00372EA4C8